MALLTQPGSRAFSTVFGVLMVGTAAVGAHGLAAFVGALAVVAVGVGTVLRRTATVAVLLSVLTVVLSDSSHVFAALSGLCAAAYLVCRYATGHAAVSIPTIVAALGFTVVGVVATSFPLQLPWFPLVAPLAVLAIYVLATRPFMG
ncbi:MAG: hypothetical protein JO236_11850 [Mycobacterium sp.]|uniref:hypothetical protein n=1 Tax=Mycobacterium sp. TaxID=1785 RepID=UPI001EB24329|nr:hypothetical protein [Mycobacterium sp.]MBW0018222.1 hypothetical protein [Mycobacterium sp.]